MVRVVIIAVTIVAMSGCGPSVYKIDKSVVDDMKDSLLVDYGKVLGQLELKCAPSATDPQCAGGREYLRKLADAYHKLKAAAKEGSTLDPALLKQILPLITTLAPLAL